MDKIFECYGLCGALEYLRENPSIEGYLKLYNRLEVMLLLDKRINWLGDTLSHFLAAQIDDSGLLRETEADLFDADVDELELYLWVNFPPTPSGAHQICNFIRDFQSDFAWNFFEDHHIKFLTAYEKQQLFALKNKLFDFNYEEEFKTSMLDVITSLYLEDVDSHEGIHPIQITFVIDHIANNFGVSSYDIISKKRTSLFARYACIYILCDLHEYTTEEIAEAFDISVDRVQEIVKQVQKFYNLNSDFKDRIDTLMEEIDEFFDVV